VGAGVVTSQDSNGNGLGASDADRRRAEICRRAAELFHREGYSKASVERIARAAGIEKPTLYHYFRSRADIVSAIHSEVYVFINEAVEEAAAAPDLTPPEVIRVIIRRILESMIEYPGYLEIYFNTHRELPPDAFRETQVMRNRFEALVHSVVKRGVDEGYMSSPDTYLTTMGLFGMCNWSNKWFGPGSSWSLDQVTDHFFNIFMQGVAITPTENSSGAISPAHLTTAGTNSR
jgi:AcrR family transcriptional regulator